MKSLRAVTIALTLAVLPAVAVAAPSMDRRPPARESVSPDGRFVAFTQGADVFLRDNDTAGATLVSRAAGTTDTPANAASTSPVVSADGGYVVFVSSATNLVNGHVDAVDAANVFLYERATGTVTLISRSAARPATTANAASGYPAISGDGAYVVFESAATDLVAGQTDAPGTADVFLYERATGKNTFVSRAAGSAATAGNGISSTPVISADGSVVAFQSFASNLVAGQDDANRERDVFLYERATGTTRLVSHRPGAPGVTGDGPSFLAVVSANGAYLAFESTASNLARGQRDTNGERDVFLYERATGAVTLVSRAAGTSTTAGDRASFLELISPDGASVVFESVATNLVFGQTITSRGLYVYGRAKGSVLFVMPTLASR